MTDGPTVSAEALAFFGRSAEGAALYALLEGRMRAALPPFTARVQKTQITFAARRGFGCASLPKGRGALMIVTFGLGRRESSPRVWHAVQAYPGRWTHHVPVAAAGDIDGELLGWLREAYDFAEGK